MDYSRRSVEQWTWKFYTLFIHVSIDGYLGCFWIGVVMNKATIKTHIQTFM